jgi:AcrR family transcriptional regulator
MPKAKPESTRAALIAAAEHLFGTKGFDRVSTREILELAGQKNQSALQYHFKDRAGLIWAVLDARLEKIEARRAAMVAAMPPAGEESPEDLAEALIRPLTEVVLEDEQGSAHVQFVIQSAHRPEGDFLKTLDSGRYPAMSEVSRRIEKKLAHLAPKERPLRKRLIVNMAVGAVSLWDATEKENLDMEQFIATAVAATVPLITLPSVLAKRAAE